MPSSPPSTLLSLFGMMLRSPFSPLPRYFSSPQKFPFSVPCPPLARLNTTSPFPRITRDREKDRSCAHDLFLFATLPYLPIFLFPLFVFLFGPIGPHHICSPLCSRLFPAPLTHAPCPPLSVIYINGTLPLPYRRLSSSRLRGHFYPPKNLFSLFLKPPLSSLG